MTQSNIASFSQLTLQTVRAALLHHRCRCSIDIAMRCCFHGITHMTISWYIRILDMGGSRILRVDLKTLQHEIGINGVVKLIAELNSVFLESRSWCQSVDALCCKLNESFHRLSPTSLHPGKGCLGAWTDDWVSSLMPVRLICWSAWALGPVHTISWANS